MIVTASIPSSATATMVLDSDQGQRAQVWLTNHGAATVWFAFDSSSDVTTSAGAKPGVPLAAGQTVVIERNPGAPETMRNQLWVVQQSGSAITVTANVN